MPERTTLQDTAPRGASDSFHLQNILLDKVFRDTEESEVVIGASSLDLALGSLKTNKDKVSAAKQYPSAKSSAMPKGRF